MPTFDGVAPGPPLSFRAAFLEEGRAGRVDHLFSKRAEIKGELLKQFGRKNPARRVHTAPSPKLLGKPAVLRFDPEADEDYP